MKPPGSKRSMKRAESARNVAAPHSKGRRLLFRLSAIVLGPLLFLMLVEAALRVAGVGYPMHFFLPMQVNGQDCLIENDRFGWRFFGPEMARTPFPFVIPKVKPSNTIRVFVFGESAAYGDPQPEFGMCRILQALLEGRYPDRHFEVINTAMTAIDSHVILPIAKDCAKQHGDFWVIYMGNNEVVGPFGSGTVFGPQAANLALVRAMVAFKATRLGQALGELGRRAQKRAPNQSEWGGMVMFLNNHVRDDDPRMATVYRSFERNLADIIDTGLDAGAKVVVSTVARNLKDCGPFASDHRPGLPSSELSRWNDLYQAGVHAQLAGRTQDALNAFKQALAMDDSFAEANFRLGQCLLSSGHDEEAGRQFKLACDQDTLRFRADGRINQTIRNAASARAREAVRLVDADAIVSAQSPYGLAGEEFLYEHVHLNYEGNFLIARAMAEQIDQEMTASNRHPWPTAEQCSKRLGWNDYTRKEGMTDMLRRLNEPPFKDQVGNREQYQRLLQKIDNLRSAAMGDSPREMAARIKAAAEATPDDWILQENLAHLEKQVGDPAGEIEALRRVTELLPQNPEVWESLGLALEQAKRNDEAKAAFQESMRLCPEAVASMNSLGELYARENHPDDAAREFQEVLRRKPYWGPAHLGLGKALEAMGRKEEAKAHFDEALKNRIRSPESFNTLAKFSFARGWYDAAVTNFSDCLQLDPSDPEVHANLGLALVKLGRREEAKTQYAEAIRLKPNFSEAHFCLGLEYGKDNDAAAASKEFAEAVRLKPDLLEARVNLGIALANQHLNQQALDQFEEVLRRDANNKVAAMYANALRAKPSTAAKTP